MATKTAPTTQEPLLRYAQHLRSTAGLAAMKATDPAIKEKEQKKHDELAELLAKAKAGDTTAKSALAKLVGPLPSPTGAIPSKTASA